MVLWALILVVTTLEAAGALAGGGQFAGAFCPPVGAGSLGATFPISRVGFGTYRIGTGE
jgi:hypothetical protein